MTREQKRLDREIKCLRQMLSTVARRRFPWCGISDEEGRREAISLAQRLHYKFKERSRLLHPHAS